MTTVESLPLAKVAIISGGASGLGLALGARCAAAGYMTVLLDRDGPRVEEEATKLAGAHAIEVIGLAVDVSDDDDVIAAARVVEERYGRADLVISNVGVQLFGAVERLTTDEWRWVLDVNVIGSARVARAFTPLLRRSDKGRLAFTTSASVLDPASHMAAYQSSKFAVWGLAETLRLELAPDGIAVSVIFPSGMISRHLETSAEAQPGAIARPVGDDDDFSAMLASNPALADAVVPPDAAARDVLDAILSDEPYIVTHGDLVTAITRRSEGLLRAATAALASTTDPESRPMRPSDQAVRP